MAIVIYIFFCSYNKTHMQRVHTYIHTYINTYIHTYIHTYIYIYIYIYLTKCRDFIYNKTVLCEDQS